MRSHTLSPEYFLHGSNSNLHSTCLRTHHNNVGILRSITCGSKHAALCRSKYSNHNQSQFVSLGRSYHSRGKIFPNFVLCYCQNSSTLNQCHPYKIWGDWNSLNRTIAPLLSTIGISPQGNLPPLFAHPRRGARSDKQNVAPLRLRHDYLLYLQSLYQCWTGNQES